MEFSKDVYYGLILQGNLRDAMAYIQPFPSQSALYNRYMSLFEQGQRIHYAIDSALDSILALYQRYYRDVFYLASDRDSAANRLKTALAERLGVAAPSVELYELEQEYLPALFQRHGYRFMGGKTSGYYGPYVWKTTEVKTYAVELPDGMQTYTVNLLDGFLVKSWIDYLSFGEISPGGWTDVDGVIHCIKSAYDFDSESFKVSLLKHEAQHARDLACAPNMSPENLEYRAKLVELIYSCERNLLDAFALEAGTAEQSNGHALAASKIMRGFEAKWHLNGREPRELSIEQIQHTARALFNESSQLFQTSPTV